VANVTQQPDRAAADAWFPPPRAAPADVRLLCLPHAGAGASVYRAWRDHLPPERVAVVPLQPPGREMRFREPPLTDVQPLVAQLVEALLPVLEPPYAIYGHSLGALVAFELARALRRARAPQPLGLLVSARPAPQLPRLRPAAHLLPDADLVAELERLGGIPAEIAVDETLLDFLMPLLRADLEVNEDYAYRHEPPLACPIAAFAGRDDPRVPAAEMEPWRAQTDAGFELHVLPGGHFVPFERADLLAPLIVAQLDAWGGS
jgi:medium-chain acyl-[acyl-carrier-protein] hydrolase